MKHIGRGRGSGCHYGLSEVRAIKGIGVQLVAGLGAIRVKDDTMVVRCIQSYRG